MKRESPLLLTIALLLLVAAFEPMASTIGPTQPPIDASALYVGRDGWGPKYADPVVAHDEYSQELIFNVYDRLITFGTPVTNRWKTWDVQEQYWEFSPGLATNVPTRQEVTGEFEETSLLNEIVILNEDPINWPFPIPIFGAYNTFWEDGFIQAPPNYAYKLTNIIDLNGNGILDPGDLVETNIYLWAPITQEKIYVVQDLWWQVIQCDQLMPYPPPLPPHSALLHLSWIPNPHETYPRDLWFYGPSQGVMYQCVGFVDNNPDGLIDYCDVIYLKEYNLMPVDWYKIGPGFQLQPVTCRTWHVRDASMLPPPIHMWLHRYYYDFNIRTSPVINFVDEAGNVVDVFDIYDAEYSFKRGLVQDPLGGPMYKFYKPLFDQMNSDYWRTGNVEDGIELAYLIEDAIEVIDPITLRINVGIPFSDMSFKQILCGTWSSIVSREFSIGIGCWDGDLFRDIDQNCVPDWLQFGTALSPYDNPVKRYVGTGPYRVIVFDPATQFVMLLWNGMYWRGWPAPDRVNFLTTIDIEYVADWPTRADAFQACRLDICDVPRSAMWNLLDNYGEPNNPHVKTIKNISPVYDLYSVLFTFAVDPTSPYVPFVGANPAPNLFNNIHMRKAFAYSFDHAAYLAGPWNNEAICRETPDVYCLTPDYYTYGPDPPWTYDESYPNAQNELQLAGVWNTGFTVMMFYPDGDYDAWVACEWISAFFETFPGTHGIFTVNVVALPRPTFQNFFEDCWLPICVMKWHANYADADDWKRAYLHSQGCLAYFQGYTSANGWNTPGPQTGLTKDQLIDLAVKTPDGPARAMYYADLDDIYIMDCPSFPIAQPLERKWMKCWVKGWYYNALYPSNYYYYKLYKADTCIGDVTGPTVGVPDGVCDMRDIGYVAGHFMIAPAPNPHLVPPYDPDWAPGTYGYGGCDLYGDRVVNMRDIGVVASHFGHRHHP